jgi:transcriptional regulator with XRE-family HTH domain
MLMLGEAERRDRFGYALQQALAVRGMSERQLATLIGVDARQVARWRSGKSLPDIYQTQAIVDALQVSEDLFRNPPEVPKPPAYPIEEYLLEATSRGARRGLTASDPGAEDGDGPSAPPARRRR